LMRQVLHKDSRVLVFCWCVFLVVFVVLSFWEK